jgi:hypothetical protein
MAQHSTTGAGAHGSYARFLSAYLFSNLKARFIDTHRRASAKHLPRCLREWCYRVNRRNRLDGPDGYPIRRAVECAIITCDQLKAGAMPEGAARIRRLPVTIAQPARACWRPKLYWETVGRVCSAW